jgi:hypothetical protein
MSGREVPEPCVHANVAVGEVLEPCVRRIVAVGGALRTAVVMDAHREPSLLVTGASLDGTPVLFLRSLS